MGERRDGRKRDEWRNEGRDKRKGEREEGRDKREGEREERRDKREGEREGQEEEGAEKGMEGDRTTMVCN